MADIIFTVKEKDFLQKIGLSTQQVAIYEILLKCNIPLKVNQIASMLGVFPHALYRQLADLESRGFIVVSGRPKKVHAIPKTVALPVVYKAYVAELARLVDQYESVKKESEIQTILIGRRPVYDYYIAEAYTASRSIDIYSIGIAYSDELYLAQKHASERGVAIRHVLQELKPENYYIAHKWAELGVSLKILKKSRGYHLFVIDRKLAVITFSNDKDTEQRVSIVVKGSVVDTFSDQFEQIWQKARNFN